MQRLWTLGINWDYLVPSDILRGLTRHQSELKLIENVTISYRITADEITSIQLHAFFDSFEKGYAAAVYIRTEASGSVQCHLVTGKSIVSPLKHCTIPRLELSGAVLSAKLLRFAVNAYAGGLSIDELHVWTDSTTTLTWICSLLHRWATFVANRTSQIHDPHTTINLESCTHTRQYGRLRDL